MKRVVAALVGTVLLSLCSCMSMLPVASKPEPGQPVGEDVIVVAGRVIMEPELQQEFKGPMVGVKEEFEKKSLIFLSKKPNKPVGSVFSADHIISQPWDEYFLAVLPRESLYWSTVYIMLSKAGTWETSLYLHSSFEISYSPDDRFIYLGDFVYHVQRSDKSNELMAGMEIRNGFEAARTQLEGDVVGPDGQPLALQNRIPAEVGELKAVIEQLRTHTAPPGF
jgi:hypothetical protein